jgi:3',5'-cyclic-AMP phosphodiesterase
MKHFYSIIFLAAFSLQSCWDAFEYSPNQIFDRNSPRDLNAKNLQRLREMSGDDTVTIAFVGDSQRFYDELHDFVGTVNRISSVDFVLLAGDITDFGLLKEYEMIEEMLDQLNKPYIGVVGNHDVLGKGEEVFVRTFGPTNFSFTYQNIKFVCHNTNSKEYLTGNVPDIAWLKQELVQSDSAHYFIPVSHVPPFSRDFDDALEGPYSTLFKETSNLLISLHAHVHNYTDSMPYNDGVRYMTSYSFDQTRFVLLKIIDGKIYHEIVNY